MALPSTGEITFAMVNVELGKASNAAISLNDADVRALAEKPTGAISLSDLRGKSAVSHQLTVAITAGSGSSALYGYRYEFSTPQRFGNLDPVTINGVSMEVATSSSEGSTLESYLRSSNSDGPNTINIRVPGERAEGFISSITMFGVTASVSRLLYDSKFSNTLFTATISGVRNSLINANGTTIPVDIT